MDDKDESVRLRAAALLFFVVQDADAPELSRRALTDESMAVRARLATTLGELIGEFNDFREESVLSGRTVRFLEQTLRDLYENERAPELIRRRALEAACASDAPWVDSYVLESSTSAEVSWRLTALRCKARLARRTGTAATPLSALLLTLAEVHIEPEQRMKAALSLRNYADAEVQFALRELAAESDPGMVRVATAALMLRGEPILPPGNSYRMAS